MAGVKYYVKLVYCYIDRDVDPIFMSLSPDHDYAVRYIPGRKTVPILKGSKLFIFENVKAAFGYLGSLRTLYREPSKLPYAGKMLWWCTAEGVQYPQQTPYKGLPQSMMERYWASYPYYYPGSQPWIYRPDPAVATLYADSVELVHVITTEEVERLVGDR